MIETVPLEQAADGYARMMQGKARFRMVLIAKDAVANFERLRGIDWIEHRSTEAKHPKGHRITWGQSTYLD